MLKQIQTTIERRLLEFINDRFGLSLERINFEVPPRLELGELATPVAFELARSLKRAPRSIAEEIATNIGPVAGVAQLEVAGAGYINVKLDRGSFAAALYQSICRGAFGLLPSERPARIVVEHTSINPNKAAHIGHLRNAAIGDTFVRLLKFLGHEVQTHNYIDNTGVQVADVVVGLQMEGKGVADLDDLQPRLDYYCWDLYARVTDYFAEDSRRLELRTRALKEIEEGNNETARLADELSRRIMHIHIGTMARINVEYDLLPRESDILKLKFWERAFALLRDRGAIYLSRQGKTAGCWVMRRAEPAETSDSPADVEVEPARAGDEKVIVRSDGTVTYIGKDIAYQLWKFGLLGLDFHYQPFHRYPSGHLLWVTDNEPTEHRGPDFGRAERVYNVIDARQSYLQAIIAEGLTALGYHDQARNSVHFSYEMVALSPACAEQLGIEVSETDRKRGFVEVSGRRGLGVKADDLINLLIESARKEVTARHELSSEASEEIAAKIAIGALRYFLTRFTRNSLIAFDFSEALSFEGETGPYCQYAVVRANNIFRKYEYGEDAALAMVEGLIESPRLGVLLDKNNELWEMVYSAARLPEAARLAVSTLEPANLAKYAFSLAQKFNLFYHKYHILSEEDPERRALLFMVAEVTRRQLEKALALMGIEVPERM